MLPIQPPTTFLRRSLTTLALTLLSSLALAAPNKVALLVGVGQYPDKDNRLEGPAHDVEAMRQVLVQRWGFAPERVQTLVDQAATRQAILQAVKGLVQRTQPGDEVLVYFSGHGTSALDPALGLPLPHGSGAFIPVDADLGHPNPVAQLVVGRTDLRPVFEQLDKGGRKVWFVSDSCFSGRQVRSLASALPSRMIPLPNANQQSLSEGARQRFQQAASQPDPWPYQNVTFLAASAEGETAKDIPSGFIKHFPTIDGKPHGAMTDALLRVLHGQEPVDANGDGQATLHEVHQAVGRFMAQRAYGHTPQRLPAVKDDTQAAGQRPLLAGKGLAAVQGSAAKPVFDVAVEPGLPGDLQRRLQALPDTRLVGHDAPAAVRLGLSKDGQTVLVRSAGSDVIARVPAGNAPTLLGTLQQLAWVNKMDALAQHSQRGVLPAEIAPAALGGTFRVGEKLHFVVRPDKDAWLMLLNVDSAGKVSVLYPYQPSEVALLKAATARAIPGDQPRQQIQVQEPLGMDMQLVLAFDEKPTNFDKWVQRLDMPPGDPRLAELERMVHNAKGRLTYARTELRVEAAPSAN
jgi:hypothetical protein